MRSTLLGGRQSRAARLSLGSRDRQDIDSDGNYSSTRSRRCFIVFVNLEHIHSVGFCLHEQTRSLSTLNIGFYNISRP